ncbi:MAG: hypothetical protein ACE5I7_18310 [Candidatus Binatia bacterium]
MRQRETDRTMYHAVVALLSGVLLAVIPHTAQAVCPGDCNTDGTVTVNELIAMVNVALGSAPVSVCMPGDSSGDGAISVNEIVAAVNNALRGCPVEPTPTPTMVPPSPTATATFGVLGTRRFVINPANSPYEAVLSPSFHIPLGGFQGQSNGETEPAFFELQAGQPDPFTGVATVSIMNSSEFIFADGRSIAPVVLCIKPILPAQDAGIVACKGGFPLSFVTTQDHNIGQVGLEGFTAEQCAAMGGSVESPNQICAAGLVGDICRADVECDTADGAGDGLCGLTTDTCSAGMAGECRSDADCDTSTGARDGICGIPGPLGEEGVCNGPLLTDQLPGDTGEGAVVIGANAQFGMTGLRARLSVQSAPPCMDPGPEATLTFGFTSGVSRATIFNFNNMLGQTLTFDVQGENFSCANWQDQDGPGALVLSAPSLNQNPAGGDIISVFTFSGR